MHNPDPVKPDYPDEMDGPQPVRRARTFVLRLVMEDGKALRGLVSEPSTDDGWRPGFASLEQLMGILEQRLK